MNEYASLRKKNSGTFFAVVALALCVAITAVMLFSRLLPYISENQQLQIPLTVSDGITHVTAIPKSQQARSSAAVCKLSTLTVLTETQGTNQTPSPAQNTAPGEDDQAENTVWLGQTDVELFRVSYENGEGNVTVNSANGDRILAPGTENEYNFTLVNSGDVNLDYTLQMEAYVSNGEISIPIAVRLVDYNGTYLVGSADSYADVLELNRVNRQESITSGYIMPYTLQWQWPFEGDDEYDTWLGNLAENEAISLTIVIHTTAEYNGDAEGGTEPPKTGDAANIAALGAAMAVSVFCLVVLLLPKRGSEEDNGQG